MNYIITGNLVDPVSRTITPSELLIENGFISQISSVDVECDTFIIPPFVDSHIHFESTMLTPSEFARTAAIYGTIGIVADPHEIANVLGIRGIRYFIEDSKKTPLKIFFGVPSCVPATDFESSGARITAKEIEELFEIDGLYFMSEFMNFPGVICQDNSVFEKIDIAKKYKKVIDGHSPGLRGNKLQKYIDAGISTDHESTTIEEAEEKILRGMKIQIRNGGAAKDFSRLYPLIDKYPDKLMFCSDDLEPSDLKKGHINLLVKEAIKNGMELMNVLKVASINPIKHYNLNVGTLKKYDPADFLIVDDLRNFNILQTYCDGVVIAENGKTNLNYNNSQIVNNFKANKITSEQLQIKTTNENIIDIVKANVIGVTDNKIITQLLQYDLSVNNGVILPDLSRDITKLIVLNRYSYSSSLAKCFVQGLQLKNIAIASSVAHDSHNIIASGTSDELICNAVNTIMDAKGGIAVAFNDGVKILKLPIAGLMSDLSIDEVATLQEELKSIVIENGCELDSPFMTLSFLSLLVIPEIKLSDKGLFDVSTFSFMNIEATDGDIF